MLKSIQEILSQVDNLINGFVNNNCIIRKASELNICDIDIDIYIPKDLSAIIVPKNQNNELLRFGGIKAQFVTQLGDYVIYSIQDPLVRDALEYLHQNNSEVLYLEEPTNE